MFGLRGLSRQQLHLSSELCLPHTLHTAHPVVGEEHTSWVCSDVCGVHVWSVWSACVECVCGVHVWSVWSACVECVWSDVWSACVECVECMCGVCVECMCGMVHVK